MQLLLTIKFWMDDTSPSFEKTEIKTESRGVNHSLKERTGFLYENYDIVMITLETIELHLQPAYEIS